MFNQVSQTDIVVMRRSGDRRTQPSTKSHKNDNIFDISILSQIRLLQDGKGRFIIKLKYEVICILV